MREDKNTEFKKEYTEEIKRTIIAFANTEGGTLYVGIGDNGDIIGIADTDAVMLRITSIIHDTIKPDVSMFTDISVIELEDKPIIKISVNRGTSRPYYLGAKGIRPEGVLIRQGAATVPASESAILKMIKDTAGDSYENERSLNQQLTFKYTSDLFNKKNVPFGETQKKTLALYSTDGTYTNLALILSDQCVHTIKAAVFEGTQKTIFKDRREFSGSLLSQINEAYDFINQFNHIHAGTEGLYRVDKRDYPPDAVREALLNAVVHREYSYAASTLISIFDDRIEFVSVGGLVQGITKNDIMLGVSVTRNRGLADIFYRLRLIEAYGTGIPKIMESYKEHVRKPEIVTSDNAFKISLPNLNAVYEQETPSDAVLNSNESAILELLRNHKILSRSQIQDAVGISQTTAIVTLGNLIKAGYILKSGKASQTKYRLSE